MTKICTDLPAVANSHINCWPQSLLASFLFESEPRAGSIAHWKFTDGATSETQRLNFVRCTPPDIDCKTKAMNSSSSRPMQEFEQSLRAILHAERYCMRMLPRPLEQRVCVAACSQAIRYVCSRLLPHRHFLHRQL